MAVRQADLEKLDREETELKDDLQSKEDQLQDRLRRIKFEEDDEHSRIEHDVEVLEKSREKFSGQENIEEEEIRTLSAKVDARRIAIADEKKVERRMVAAEHEAERMREEQTAAPIPLAKPVIDTEELPEPDLEPALPRKPEIKVAKPVMPELPAKPELWLEGRSWQQTMRCPRLLNLAASRLNPWRLRPMKNRLPAAPKAKPVVADSEAALPPCRSRLPAGICCRCPPMPLRQPVRLRPMKTRGEKRLLRPTIREEEKRGHSRSGPRFGSACAQD